ncbi:sensor histidine kinase [Mycoplasmatota bacterium]|nr:sensor histidine kinase [Mycoplasmatota bacterium]
MKLRTYLKDEKWLVVLQISTFIFLIIFFMLINLSLQDILIINLFMISLNILYHIIRFIRKRNYYNDLLYRFDSLDEKTLVSEFIDESLSEETKIYHDIIEGSCISYNNKIAEIEKMRDEYREYIERWVHEIKLPISVIKLISDKTDTPDSRSIKEENEIIEKYVEQALFYARSYNIEKDYFVNEIVLLPVVKKAINKHRSQVIAKNVHLSICQNSELVLTDSKWIEFVISQILDNAVKYSDETEPEVFIVIEKRDHSIILSITNNGKGIPSQDIKRVFEKGFTGQNGRAIGYSTGMGLYLVKKICDGLGHKVVVTSERQKTTVSIIFSVLQLT